MSYNTKRLALELELSSIASSNDRHCLKLSIYNLKINSEINSEFRVNLQPLPLQLLYFLKIVHVCIGFYFS